MKTTRGNLLTSVRNAAKAGDVLSAQRMTKKSGPSTHHVAAILGGATCVSGQAQTPGPGVGKQAGDAAGDATLKTLKMTLMSIRRPAIATSHKMETA